MKYLKEFVIGSSVILFIPAFYKFNRITPSVTNINNPYIKYTIFFPIVTGLANALSLIIKEYFGLSNHIRFLLLTIITWFATTSLVKYYKLYNFTDNNKRMNEYYIKLFITYFVFWNIVIYNLEKYI